MHLTAEHLTGLQETDQFAQNFDRKVIDVKRLPHNEGVYEDLESKLVRVLEALPKFDEEKLTVKISRDRTSMGKRIHVTNYAFLCLLRTGDQTISFLW